MDYKITKRIEVNECKIRIQIEDSILANKIINMAYEHGCSHVIRKWESKYNSFVCDYEPFCSEGFYNIIWVTFRSRKNLLAMDTMKFFEHQLLKYLNSITTLENIFKENIDLILKENKIIRELKEA